MAYQHGGQPTGMLYMFFFCCSFFFFNVFVTKFVMEGRKRTGLAWEDSGEIYSDKLKQLRTLRALKHQLSRLSPRSLSAFVSAVSRSQAVHPSLHSVSLSEFPLHGGFIGSLHANYCNQTQVFLILHLTHLLTAVS